MSRLRGRKFRNKIKQDKDRNEKYKKQQRESRRLQRIEKKFGKLAEVPFDVVEFKTEQSNDEIEDI